METTTTSNPLFIVSTDINEKMEPPFSELAKFVVESDYQYTTVNNYRNGLKAHIIINIQNLFYYMPKDKSSCSWSTEERAKKDIEQFIDNYLYDRILKHGQPNCWNIKISLKMDDIRIPYTKLPSNKEQAKKFLSELIVWKHVLEKRREKMTIYLDVLHYS